MNIRSIKYCLLSFFVTVGTLFSVFSQSTSWEAGKALVYDGYRNNKKSSWEQGIQLLKSEHKNNPDDLQILYELSLAEYGMIGYCLGHEICGNYLNELFDEVEDNLEILLEAKPKSSEYHAMMGALLAMKIGLNPAKAIFLGPKSSKHIYKAVDYDQSNPSAWVELGNMRFHAPGIFGGDMEEAVICFDKAVSLFESQPTKKKNNWLYLHALAWLGQAYEKEDEPQKALAIYQKTLLVEPDFQWVRDELLPDLKKRMSGK